MGEFLQSNWFWIVLIVFFVWIRACGMSCGGHGHRNGKGRGDAGVRK